MTKAKSRCQNVYVFHHCPVRSARKHQSPVVVYSILLYRVPARSKERQGLNPTIVFASLIMSKIPVGIQQKGKPWPGYFLVRTTGEVVPLIAVDELPTTIELVGVPRSLDLEETIGMLNLGLKRSTGGFYQIALEQGSKILSNEVVGKAE